MGDDSESEEIFSPQSAPTLDFDDVIGLDEQLTEIEQTILESATGDVPDSFRTLSLLFYGPKGGGKRRTLRAVAGELGSAGYDYQWVESLSRRRTQGAEFLDELFTEAIDHQPTGIVLDCFDQLLSEDVVRTVANRLDTVRQGGDDVVVLSAIDEQQLHHAALWSYIQSVDVVIEVELPDIDRRRGILRDRLSAVSESVDGVDVEAYDLARLARETDQFGVDDLEMVARRAAVTAGTDVGFQPPLDEDDIVAIIASVDRQRIEQIRDEATLTNVDVPAVTFDDVGGYEDVKRTLVEQVQQCLSCRDLGEDLGLDFSGGILLHGPPGTGKTMLIRALANELDYTFIPVHTPGLKAGRGGPTERIPVLFHRAERNAPAILFFDEFDTLATRRGLPKADETAVNTMLTELDGIEQRDGIVVIAATNLPQTLDPALLRPGRFDYHLEIGHPDAAVQAEIFARQTADLPLAADVTPEWFAGMTDEVTGADIAAICERAVTIAMREFDDVTAVTASDIELSCSTMEVAYQEFESGRLHQDDLGPSPAFQ